MIQYPDGRERLWLRRGEAGPWLVCRIEDVSTLPAARVAELTDWIGALGAGAPLSVVGLTVSMDDSGQYRVHLAFGTVEVPASSIPAWLLGPQPDTDLTPDAIIVRS